MDSETLESGRTYITPEGNKYYSATTFLSKTSAPGKKIGLERWKQRIGRAAAQKELNRCCERGEAVHLANEYYLKNESPDKVRGAAGSYYPLFRKLIPLLDGIDNVRALEIPLYSDVMQLAGRVDCIADYKGVPSIIDFKTSTNVKYNSNVQDYRMQCVIYSLMLEERYGIRHDQLVILMTIEKTPQPKIFKFQRTEEDLDKLAKRLIQFRKTQGE